MKQKIVFLAAVLLFGFYFPVTVVAAPAVTNVVVYDTGYETAVILWDTDVPSDSDVEYGTTTTYDSALPTNSMLTTSHTVTLEHLQPSTTYHFIVKSKDANDERTVSSDYTFITQALPEGSTPNTGTDPTLETLTAPVISSVVATNITGTTALITWETSKPGDSQVWYGTTTAYSNSSFHDYSSILEHSMSLTGLTPKTEYNFKVKSIGSTGLWSESPDATFTTFDESVLPSPSSSLGLSMPSEAVVTPTPPPAVEEVKPVVFPYNVRFGDMVKFRKSRAIYIVKASGLYPFATYADYLTYKKASKRSLKTFPGDGSGITLHSDAARW